MLETNWVDIHCHLDHLEEGVDVAIQKAREVGINKIITIGTEPNDLAVVLKIAEENYPNVFCTLGIHPHEGVHYTDEIGKYIEQKAAQKEVVSIGEIGLDFYYNQSPKEEQFDAFRKQMQIAQRTGLPVMIHSREADPETVDILKEFPDVKGVIHCFTGTEWFAMQALDLGYNISISGIVTFPKAGDLRDIVKKIPLDRLHVETDAPFLAPVPMRGKKNTSAYMVHTAKVVAELKSVSIEELAKQTNENAKLMFTKMVWR